MATKHTCYFSKVDRNSQILIEQLKDSSFFREFRYICVDPLPSTGKRPPLPPYVRSVPMLIIEGETAPLVDAAIQNWISERKLRESGTSGVDGDWGLSGIAGGEALLMSEILSATDKAPTMTNRVEGSMVSFTSDDSQFGKMMASDAPIGTTGPKGGPAMGGGRGPSAKLQEFEARMDLMTKMRSELTGPMTAPTPPVWITQGAPQQPGTPQQNPYMQQQQYSQQQLMMAQRQQLLRQQQQQQQQQLLRQQQQQQMMRR